MREWDKVRLCILGTLWLSIMVSLIIVGIVRRVTVESIEDLNPQPDCPPCECIDGDK